MLLKRDYFVEKLILVMDKVDKLIFYHKIKYKVSKLCSGSELKYPDYKSIVFLERQIYDEINSIDKKDLSLYYTMMISTLYKLNIEMIDVILQEKYYSANALCRLITELLMTVIYCEENPEYKKILCGENRKGKPIWTKELKKALEKSKKFKYINNILDDWNFFSEFLHPMKPHIYATSIWQYDEENKKMRLYIQRNKEEGKIIHFTNRHFMYRGHIDLMINRFFTYSIMAFELLKGENIIRF